MARVVASIGILSLSRDRNREKIMNHFNDVQEAAELVKSCSRKAKVQAVYVQGLRAGWKAGAGMDVSGNETRFANSLSQADYEIFMAQEVMEKQEFDARKALDTAVVAYCADVVAGNNSHGAMHDIQALGHLVSRL